MQDDLKLLESLARAACVARGRDPDQYPDNTTGRYFKPFPDYAPDGIERPWHHFAEDARNFLAFSLALLRAPNTSQR